MKKTWILLLIFFSAGILSYADAQSVKNLNTKEFKVQIWDFEKNKDWKYLGDKPAISIATTKYLGDRMRERGVKASFALGGIPAAIIDMYATWCPPCKKLSPILEEIQKEYGDKLQIYKVDVDKEPALAQLFNASSIPLMLFIPKNGKPFTVTGLRPKEQITDIINEKLEVKK